METCRLRSWRRVGVAIVCVAILVSPGACTTERAWNDTTPGDTCAELGDVVLGVGYLALYVFAQMAGGGGNSSPFSEYSYTSGNWR
jgi:hypothetical protein